MNGRSVPRSAWRAVGDLARLAAVAADPPEQRDLTEEMLEQVRQRAAALRGDLAVLRGRAIAARELRDAELALDELVAAIAGGGEPAVVLRAAVDLTWSLEDIERAIEEAPAEPATSPPLHPVTLVLHGLAAFCG